MSGLVLPALDLPRLPFRERLASDEQLARLVSRGQPRAFAVLYERHHQALFRYCCSIVRDGDDAQDALQSAFTRALTSLQAGERDLAVRPWLFRIVHNEAITLLRRRRLPASALSGERVASVDASMERTVEDRERLAALVADLQTLPERQRAALVMRELAGLTIEEIAAALATSTGGAKQAVFEARSALHQLAEGRAMDCHEVRRTISERDGRMLRARKLRAHLRVCEQCCTFRASIHTRGEDLSLLTPVLPASALAAVVRSAVHGAGAGAGGAPAGIALTGSATTLGGPATASLALKALAGAVLMTAATAGTVQLTRHHHAHRDAGALRAIDARSRPAPASSSSAIGGGSSAGPGQARPSGGAQLARGGSGDPSGPSGSHSVRRTPGTPPGTSATPPLPRTGDPAPATQAAPVTPTGATGAAGVTHPSQPATPSQPSTPSQPASPAHPSHPTHPAHPAHPSTPSQPPAQPATPAPDPPAAQGGSTPAQSPGASGQAPGHTKPNGSPGTGADPASPPGASHGHRH